MKTVDISNGTLIIKFLYDPQTVAQVRCLPMGRRWDPVTKAWFCPASIDALKSLREWGFLFSPEVTAWEENWNKPKTAPEPITEIPGLTGTLRPFQAEDVGFIDSKAGRCLVANEMGLGKTIEALAWLQHEGSPALPAVVICPASLKGNWERECRAWTKLHPCIISGRGVTLPTCYERRDVLYICNYDILDHWKTALGKVCSTVVLDECHYARNPKTLRTKAVKEFCKNKRHVIALSGTPIVNRPIEFFTTLNIIAPNIFGKYWDYARRFCDAKATRFGWDVSGSSHPDELNRLLKGIMIRRTKDEVLKDLPPKTRTTVPLELNGNMGIYDASLREALGTWRDEKPSQLQDITCISKLRQAAMAAKDDLCEEWIDNFLETGKKLVIFVLHHSTTDRLMARYSKGARHLDGRVDVRERSKVVEEFQTNPDIKLLIGNIQVAGTGFTLTAAQDAVFLEFPWTPGELSQAEDRIHRIGQTGAANIYYLIALGTLEEDIVELIETKRAVIGAVLDGGYDESTSVLKELINRIKRKGMKK